ncbi:MAG: phytoene/squalene synthase family protein [Candidatus Omnitrophota bacterium]
MRASINEGYRIASRITRQYARSFYFSSRFLPPDKKYALFCIYAICRLSDEAVDSSAEPGRVHTLERLKEKIDLAYAEDDLSDSLLLSFKETIERYAVPKKYFEELISGMYLDLSKNRYQNFQELHEYCYKVAGVIGLTVSRVFGLQDPLAEKHAVSLGIAMQLTNILRDIGEDYRRGRIYLPQDELSSHGVNETDIASGRLSPNLKALFKFQIERARQYYRGSEAGISMITDRRCRLTASAIKEFYSAILEAIEKNGYDVFSRRASAGRLKKILIISALAMKS